FIHGAFQQEKHAGSCMITVVRRGTSLEITVQNPLRGNSSTPTFGAEKGEGLGFKILRSVLKRSGGSIVTEEQAGNAMVTLTIPWEEME
ncbi:MAG: hypothetical protein EA427_03380, partial [Spirochaetaceae bacterium]